MAIKSLSHPKANGIFRLIYDEANFRHTYQLIPEVHLLTIVWNKRKKQQILIDGVPYVLPQHGLVALVANQSYSFERPEDIVAWQFNREFYCIIDHDQEVSCSGLLFYGSGDHPILQLEEGECQQIDALFQVFLDEFSSNDNLQEDMMRILLKRLIIKSTRLYKKQYNLTSADMPEIDTIRKFNLLVESNYKQWHKVQEYANEMYKSPKTISNIFSKLGQTSPLKVIHNRIVLEAKRMLLYTDMTIKEIAYDLGFDDVSPFNRIFKKNTAQSPSAFRKIVVAQ